MSAFTMGLTAKGAALYAKVQTGIQLHFTRLAMGDGDLGGSQAINLNALISEKVSLAVTELEVLPGGLANIGGVMQPSDVVVGFYWKEFGVFAADPDVGEILYWYGNAGAQSEWIPPNGGGTLIEKHINITPIVGNASNITATIDQSLVYATAQDLVEHEKDYTLQIPYAGVTTGISNTYEISAPAITSLTAGMAVSIKFNVDSTGASTLNWCGFGAKPIKKTNGSDATNLKASGIYTLRFDGTNFILQGEGGEYGTATASDVLIGKTIGTDGGIITGTMPNNGPDAAETINLTTQNQEYTITAGHHTGLRKIKAIISNLVASVIKAGTIVGGIVGTFTADATATAADILNGKTAGINGVMTTGAMPNNGAQSATLDTSTTSKTIPAGYTSGGTVNIVTQEKSMSPSNVVQDVTPDAGKVLSKVTVSAVARHASGSTNGNGTRSITVSGLSFTPSSVIWMYIYGWTKSTNNKVAYKSGSSLMTTSSEFVESITISGTSFTITVPDGYILPTSTAYVWYALEQ